MANLKNLKDKRASFLKTAKVTKAMELISAIKMRNAQKKAIDARLYSYKVFAILKRLSKIVDSNINEIFQQEISENGKKIFVLISPDKGLTGGMNSRLFKKVENEIQENSDFKKEWIVIGKKGYDFLTKSKEEILKYFYNIKEKTDLELFKEVSDLIESKIKTEKISEIKVIFTEFINTAEQKPKSRTIFPIIYDDVKEVLKAIRPTKGKYSNIKQINIDNKDVPAYIFEPDIKTVIESLVPFIINIMLFHSLLESFASEHSSRMIAMKNATEKAEEKAEESRKIFNKQRQANITSEISEIVSGIEAMK